MNEGCVRGCLFFFRFWGIIEITYRFKLYPILHFPLSIAALNCSLVILSGTDIVLFTCVFLLLCFFVVVLFCCCCFVIYYLFFVYFLLANLPQFIIYIYNYFCVKKDIWCTIVFLFSFVCGEMPECAKRRGH